MRDATRVVRAGLEHTGDETPFLPGPTFAAPYHLRGDPEGRAYGYGRYGNPTWSAWEAALGELEGGFALSFASGMAAVSAALYAGLAPGDVLVFPDDGYPGVRRLAARLPVEARPVASTAEAFRAALPGASAVWLESPTNPGLDVLPLEELIAAAHAAGAWVAVDNTLATPLTQAPLALGADVSVSSASKMMSGHSDLVLGYLAVRDHDRFARLKAWRDDTGAVPGPLEAWLAHRSLATLDVRLRRAQDNAQRIARALEARKEVAEVRQRGTLVCFVLRNRARADAFLAACELVAEATSFGGVHTSAERRGRWGTDAVPDGFIRLSAGIESGDDLVEDVLRSLDALAG